MTKATTVWLAAIGLVLLVVVAYLPVLNAGFIWDDDAHVQKNLNLRSVEGLGCIWFQIGATPQYYPMVHTTFWLEYRLWGLRPAGYHAVNLLLHALAALLAWRVLEKLELPPAAWAAAALFALHPLQVESVAWITERKNVLSAVFYLAALLAYLHAARRAAFAVAAVLFVMALLSKTVTGSLPLVVLLLAWWKRGRIDRREVGRMAPFVGLAALLGTLTVWIEKTQVGATGAEWSLTLAERGLVAGRAFWFYLGKLVWPSPLVFVYPRWEVVQGSLGQWLFPLAALALLVVLWLARGRVGRGPLVAALFFAVTLGPALGFFDVFPMRYSFVADHFQYLAGLGPLALVAAGSFRLARNGGRVGVRSAALALALVLVLFGGSTWRRAGAFSSAETLWRDTLSKNPEAWMAHANMGVLREAEGRLDEALHHFREAVRIQEERLPGAFDRGRGYSNIGMVLLEQGREPEGIESLQRALEIDPGNPYAHHNMGVYLLDRGRYRDAIANFRLALLRKPDHAEAWAGIGDAFLATGSVDEAIECYAQALLLDPDAPALRARMRNARALHEN